MAERTDRVIEGVLWLLLAASAAVFVAGCAHAAAPDELSAAAHRREAARQSAAATTERGQYDPKARADEDPTEPLRISDDNLYPSYNPTQYHLANAARDDAHAKQHLQAADRLEQFENRECRKLPVDMRGSCPLLGPLASVSGIAGGVRLRFQPGVPVDAVLAHMRCHLAYAEAHGYQTATECLIYVKGAEIRRARDGQSIEVVAHDRAVIDELRRRSSVWLGTPSI